MTEASSRGDDPRLALAHRIDEVCNRFEVAWQAGQRPRIEDVVNEIPEPGRVAAVHELIALEMSYRRQAGELPQLDEYRARFPDLTIAQDTPGPSGTPQPDSAAARPALPGFEVLGELGRGGMGVVYLARQRGLDRLVALKVVKAGAHASTDERTRFLHEAEAIARLRHPNVVEIYQVGEQDGLPYFAMEFCPDGSLARQWAGGPQAPQRAAELVEILAGAVQAAHAAGVVHRDLKPANVLLAADGTPKVSDFGLAKKLEGTTELTATGAILGTPSYMAPEQASGNSKHVGPAADVYALGAMLYEGLTGRPPFRAATAVDTLLQVLTDLPVPPSRLRPGLSADLEAICLRCLEKKPGLRFASAAELADALHRFLDGLPAQVRPTDDQLSDRAQLRRRRAAGCVGLLLLYFLPPILGLALAARLPKSDIRGLPLLLILGLWVVGPFAAFVIWNLKQRRQVDVLTFSPDGKLLASVSQNGQLKLWDVARERLRSFRGQTITRAVAFTPDGQTLLALDDRGTSWTWDVADGRFKVGFQLPIEPIGAAIAPDCRTLATVSRSPLTLTLWQTNLAGGVSRLVDVSLAEVGFVFSPGLRFVAEGRVLAASTPKGLKLWEVRAEGLRERRVPKPYGVLALSPDGRMGAYKGSHPFWGNNDTYSIVVWDIATDRRCCELARTKLSENREWLGFAPEGRILAHSIAGAHGTRLYLLDPLTGRHLGNVAVGDKIAAGAFAPDGQTLAIGDNLGLVTWHDVGAIRRAGRHQGEEREQAKPIGRPVGAALVGPVSSISEASREAPPAKVSGASQPQPRDRKKRWQQILRRLAAALVGPASRETGSSAEVPSDLVPASPVSENAPAVPPLAEGDVVRLSVAAPSAGESETPTVLPPDDRCEATAPPPQASTLSSLAAPLAAGCPEIPGYELLALLGQGGMGVVYQARQLGLDRLVALKVLLAGSHASPEERTRFRREAEAIARLHHPNVVHIYEVGEHNGLPYFSMELCPGGTLAQQLAGHPLPPWEAAMLLATLARGVHAAHQVGVIHRDLKPANILLEGARGEGPGTRTEQAGNSSALAPRPSPLAPRPCSQDR